MVYFYYLLALLAAIDVWVLLALILQNRSLRRNLDDTRCRLDHSKKTCEAQSLRMSETESDIKILIRNGMFLNSRNRFTARGCIPRNIVKLLRHVPIGVRVVEENEVAIPTAG